MCKIRRCFCCSLRQGAVVAATFCFSAYTTCLAVTIWWISVCEEVVIPSFVLACIYFVLVVISATFLIALAGQRIYSVLYSWLIAVSILLVPESALCALVCLWYLGTSDPLGLGLLIFYIIRTLLVIVSIIHVYVLLRQLSGPDGSKPKNRVGLPPTVSVIPYAPPSPSQPPMMLSPFRPLPPMSRGLPDVLFSPDGTVLERNLRGTPVCEGELISYTPSGGNRSNSTLAHDEPIVESGVSSERQSLAPSIYDSQLVSYTGAKRPSITPSVQSAASTLAVVPYWPPPVYASVPMYGYEGYPRPIMAPPMPWYPMAPPRRERGKPPGFLRPPVGPLYLPPLPVAPVRKSKKKTPSRLPPNSTFDYKDGAEPGFARLFFMQRHAVNGNAVHENKKNAQKDKSRFGAAEKYYYAETENSQNGFLPANGKGTTPSKNYYYMQNGDVHCLYGEPIPRAYS